MGIATVATCADADADAPHVRAADDSVHVASYLDIDAVVEAARRAGADAVHPGYGFLSERSEFARALEAAGIALVGPSAEVMDRMGRKDHAREIAVAAGVPVVPSYDVDTPASELAFPVLVKAAAGGGGKGMRIVRSAAEYADALAAARREARSAFGDDTLLVETYVERGRHVEVQVLGDAHGTVVHLFERDCSTQRRHQKVLEEAPAPTISADMRELLTTSAVALAREAGYTNAGTVEFLVDDRPGAEAAYFLEMNTRLQVEHPVTEEVVRVSGASLDLVELQLRVAMGEPLPFGQEDVSLSGHAIEARVYAEDAFHGFLPQAGTAELVHWSPRARNEVALASGQEVGSAYDPMIGKVVVHGPDREAARRRLVGALDDTAILGLTTNTGFLRALVASEQLATATIDTAWLDRNPDAIQPQGGDQAAVFAAWAVADHEIRQRPGDPFGTADGWRLAGPSAPATVTLIVDGERVPWTVSWKRLTGPGGAVSTRLVARDGALLHLEIDGRLQQAAVQVGHRYVDVVHRGNTFRFERPDPFRGGGSTVGEAVVLAPMPGTVLAVEVSTGQQVEKGDRLGVLEAMKMELVLTAPHAGVVSRVLARTGEQVRMGAELFEVEETDDPA